MCGTILFVASLLALSSDDYFAREAAGKIVAVLVRDNPATYGPPVAHAASLHPSPEVRSRCGRLTGAFHAFLADSYVMPTGRPPCCDWAYDSGAFPDCHDWPSWMCLVPQETGPQTCSPEWSRYRSASELYVRSMIRMGYWSHADADAAIHAAWQDELKRFVERYPEHVATVEQWSRAR